MILYKANKCYILISPKEVMSTLISLMFGLNLCAVKLLFILLAVALNHSINVLIFTIGARVDDQQGANLGFKEQILYLLLTV